MQLTHSPVLATFALQISTLLLHHAPDDLESPHLLRRAVEDLANVRSSKMRRWMQSSVRDRVNAIKLNNLSMHEIQIHRPVLTRVLNDLYRIHVPGLDASLLQSQSTTTPSASGSASAPAQETPGAQRRTLRRVIRRT